MRSSCSIDVTFALAGHPIDEKAADIPEVTPLKGRFEHVSSTLWRMREDYCASIIQQFFRKYVLKRTAVEGSAEDGDEVTAAFDPDEEEEEDDEEDEEDDEELDDEDASLADDDAADDDDDEYDTTSSAGRSCSNENRSPNDQSRASFKEEGSSPKSSLRQRSMHLAGK